ncbi:hypothetical protein CC80DRAFT_489823 [Byssothecium circinans]|uniref:Uncharacterized protein n=1 Tax=Byssothecium circinans TaxID=147558 RepID=A0A6A5U3L1_9PLEO|nr:hypothetical protein CC80DRAFT_489823 [Byssothecium circinans]
MFSKTVIVAAISALFASQAIAAAVSMDERAAMIAPDPIAACNCPNNCRHKNGSSCKFYDNGNTISGECQIEGDHLKCVA